VENRAKNPAERMIVDVIKLILGAFNPFLAE
jgi:hypothetical protein